MHNLNVAVLLIVGILVTVAKCESDFDKIQRCVNEALQATMPNDHCNPSTSNDGDVAVFKEDCCYNPAITQADFGKYIENRFTIFNTNNQNVSLLDAKVKAFTDSFNSKVGGTGSCVVAGSHNKDFTTLRLCIDCTNLSTDNADSKPLSWNWNW